MAWQGPQRQQEKLQEPSACHQHIRGPEGNQRKSEHSGLITRDWVHLVLKCTVAGQHLCWIPHFAHFVVLISAASVSPSCFKLTTGGLRHEVLPYFLFHFWESSEVSLEESPCSVSVLNSTHLLSAVTKKQTEGLSSANINMLFRTGTFYI